MLENTFRVICTFGVLVTIFMVYWVSFIYKRSVYASAPLMDKQSQHVPLQTQNATSQTKQPIDNFEEFPCLDGKVPASGVKRNGQCVRTVVFSERNTHSDWCTDLKIRSGTQICTYDPKYDNISGHLHRKGQWEKHLIDKMFQVFKKTPNIMLFDVGSNIGVYCISAAFYQRHAVCLDANYENLWKLLHSLHRGNLTENVTLIWNAVSNVHTKIQFHIAKGNIGMSRIDDLRKWKTQTTKNITVNSIMLDDLQDLSEFRNRPVFLKIDVESHELYVLQGATEFFKKVDVRVVQMELQEKSTKIEVIELLETYGYTPYRNPLTKDKLIKSNALREWPGDVYFLKNN